MIKIHATWLPAKKRGNDAGLFIWGEILEEIEVEEEEESRDLPYGLAPRGLRSVLRNVADGLLYECAEEERLEFLWPTLKGQPLLSQDPRDTEDSEETQLDEPGEPEDDSSSDRIASEEARQPLAGSHGDFATLTVRETDVEAGLERETDLEEQSNGDVDPSEPAPSLDRWFIDGLRIPASDSPHFLNSVAEIEEPEIVWGPSIRFWVLASQFCLDLVARARFVPTLVGEDERARSLRALWKPVLSADEDRRTLQALIERIPRVSLSWEFPEEETTEAGVPEESPVVQSWKSTSVQDSAGRIYRSQTLVRGFVDTVLDHSLRLRLAESGFPDRGRRQKARSQALGGPVGIWLRSLAWIDDRLEIGTQAVEDFGAEVRRWNQMVVDPEAGTYRLYLRLLSPQDAADDPRKPWRLEFHLQACDDPNVLAPAEAVWRCTELNLRWQNRQFPNVQERLLTELARTAELFPPIARALESATPSHCELEVDEAYSLLVFEAPLLLEAGAVVEAPSWWKGTGVRPSLKLYLRPAAESEEPQGVEPRGEGDPKGPSHALLDYSWEVALGQTTLSADQFHKLAASKMPLVKIGQEWIELRPDDTEVLDRVLREVTRKPKLTLAEALRLGLGGQSPQGSIAPPEIQAEGWVKDLIEQAKGTRAPEAIQLGEEFKGELRPYQERGLGWLHYLEQFGFGGCLADDMGLGKTIQLIGLLLYERRDRTNEETKRVGLADMITDGGKRIGPTLVLSPMSVVGNWQREVERFAPELAVMIHHGLNRLKDSDFLDEVAHHDVIISTYALARRDYDQFKKVRWHRIVLDEAQNIKNPTTQQSKAVRSLDATFRVALTGTPLENRLAELWSIFDFLNPEYLGTLGEFRRRFSRPIEKEGNPERRKLLHNLTRPFLLRRVKTDPDVIRDLPEKLEMRIFCNLTQEQAGLYQAVLGEMMNQIEKSQGIERRGLILATLTRLKQICNHPAHYIQDGSAIDGRSGKVERLTEMLEEVLSVGDRALCFTQFTEMGTLLKGHLMARFGQKVLFLHGGVPQAERDRMVDEFQDPEGPPVFILSVRAGGIGLNLTAANHVFHFDRWWNPAVENQATDRAFRIGQTRNVQVHKFVCVGTLEERIDRIIEEKRSLADMVLGAGENWLTELNTDQLREVLSLSRDAVSEG